ncbi:MAG: zinc ribbon domain-containing protein [Candidatus Heimdallarchaeaceae archaeon]
MSYTMEGKDKHFFYAGLTHIIGVFIIIVLTMIYYYILANSDYSYNASIMYIFGIGSVRLVVTIIYNVFLFLAFSNLDTKLNLKSTEEMNIITKLILAQLMLMVLILLSFGIALLMTIAKAMFYVIGVGYILSGVVGLFTYLYIYKLIQKQESSVLAKTISAVFLVYSITFFLNGTIYGLFNFDIGGLYNIIQPLVTTFSSLESLVMIIVAFILILFSIQLSTKKFGIIVPNSIGTKSASLINCKSCGQTLEAEEQFCINCGKKVE